MTFSGCERIKNSLGLGSSANVEIPANPEIPDNSNKSESPTNKTDCKRRFEAPNSSYLLSKNFAIKAAAVVALGLGELLTHV
jgi:hypothetical protein